MGLRLLVICYVVGLIFGSLSALEWIVSRLVKLWLAGFFAGLAVCLVSAVTTPFIKLGRRRIAR